MSTSVFTDVLILIRENYKEILIYFFHNVYQKMILLLNMLSRIINDKSWVISSTCRGNIPFMTFIYALCNHLLWFGQASTINTTKCVCIYSFYCALPSFISLAKDFIVVSWSPRKLFDCVIAFPQVPGCGRIFRNKYFSWEKLLDSLFFCWSAWLLNLHCYSDSWQMEFSLKMLLVHAYMKIFKRWSWGGFFFLSCFNQFLQIGINRFYISVYWW